MISSSLGLITYLVLFYFIYVILFFQEYKKQGVLCIDIYRNVGIKSILVFTALLYVLSELLSVINCLKQEFIIPSLYVVSLFLFYFYLKLKLYRFRIELSLFKSNEKILVYIISFICIITFCVALIFPPSTDDSYTYHLPRIYHWLQNGTFTHYYTTVDRQLFSAPLAEILIMYSLVFDVGSDYLVNLPQWFSFVSILFTISRICSLLGFNMRVQLLGMLFFSTLPTAILESTSTQNDLVVCLFLTIALERLLVWIKDCSLSNTLYFALALGLAVLTKGTAYIIGLPIVVIFAWYCFKNFKKRILFGIVAGLVCLSINLPHYYRNIVYFGDPLEAYSDTKSTFGTDAFIFGGPLNLYTQIPLPLPESDNINKKITSINKEVIPYGPLQVSSDFNDFFIRLLMFHEDISINFFHFVLLIVSSIIILVKHRERFPLVLWAIVLFYVFSVSVPWQPWITRLQLPMFAYFSIVFAVGIGYLKLRIQRVIIGALVYFLCTILCPCS